MALQIRPIPQAMAVTALHQVLRVPLSPVQAAAVAAFLLELLERAAQVVAVTLEQTQEHLP
jgi:hypothetical protein